MVLHVTDSSTLNAGCRSKLLEGLRSERDSSLKIMSISLQPIPSEYIWLDMVNYERFRTIILEHAVPLRNFELITENNSRDFARETNLHGCVAQQVDQSIFIICFQLCRRTKGHRADPVAYELRIPKPKGKCFKSWVSGQIPTICFEQIYLPKVFDIHIGRFQNSQPRRNFS